MLRDPLIELAERENETAMLVHETGNEGKFDGVVARAQKWFEEAEHAIDGAKREGAMTGIDGIEKIDKIFFFYRRGHGNLRKVELRESGANATTARDGSGDAEAEAIGAFVADDLERRAGHGRAFDLGSAIGVEEIPREGGEETAHGRTKADTGDVDLHLLALGERSGRGYFSTHAG